MQDDDLGTVMHLFIERHHRSPTPDELAELTKVAEKLHTTREAGVISAAALDHEDDTFLGETDEETPE